MVGCEKEELIEIEEEECCNISGKGMIALKREGW